MHIFLLFLFSSLSVQANCINQSVKAELDCPKISGFTPLGNRHTPAGIFLGYERHGNSDNSEYLLRLVRLIKKTNPALKINLTLSKEVLEKGKLPGLELIMKKFPQTNLVPLSEEMPSWMQDPIEFSYHPNEKTFGVIGLPYPRSPSIYKDLAKSCQIEAMDSKISSGVGGNHGGNVEHLFANNIAIGDSSTKELRAYFENIGQKVYQISVNWLEVGHVDEVLLPLPGDRKCPVTLGHASPLKAFELLGATSAESCNSIVVKNLKKIGFQTKVECQFLHRASKVYEQKILDSLKQIEMDKICIKRFPIPVIFFPEQLEAIKYGRKSDKARSILPNAANSIVLGKTIIAPWQRVKVFEDYLSRSYKEMGLMAHFIKNKQIHWSGGNIHCTTNVMRVCK